MGDSITIYYLPLLVKLIIMNTDMFNQMTYEEIIEYLQEQEADNILSSIEWQEKDYSDCFLPA